MTSKISRPGELVGPTDVNLPRTYKRPKEIPKEVPVCFRELNELTAI